MLGSLTDAEDDGSFDTLEVEHHDGVSVMLYPIRNPGKLRHAQFRGGGCCGRVRKRRMVCRTKEVLQLLRNMQLRGRDRAITPNLSRLGWQGA